MSSRAQRETLIPRNAFTDLENATEDELKVLEGEFRRLSARAEEHPRVHEEAHQGARR